MSWLSFGTKIVPAIWKGGTKATSTLWKGVTAVGDTGLKTTGAMLRNPKTTVVGGITAYAGWKMLDDPQKSLGTHVGETAREAVKGIGGFAHDVVNGVTGEDAVEQVRDTAAATFHDLSQSVSETKGILGTIGEGLSGLGTFLGSLFGGNASRMFSNFLGNITSGRLSGLGVGALIAACYMLFGRTGLLGKIGGAMLAMMMIGSHSESRTRTQEPQVAPAQEQQHTIHR